MSIHKYQEYVLPASILVAGLLIAGSVLYVSRNGSPARVPAGADTLSPTAAGENSGPTIAQTDAVLGDAKAPVTLIEYGDYQCPFCARFFEGAEKQIRSAYIQTGKVKMVFKNFQFLGSESTAAAAAAECAKEQNKYWEYHEALYQAESRDGHENNGNLTKDLFIKLAGDLNLNLPVFTGCVTSGKYEAKVKQDTQDAGAAGVNSTPTIFINGTKVQGAQPFEQFKTIIDGFLAKK